MQTASPNPLLLRDTQRTLPLGQTLLEDDVVLLLTPVVIPAENPPKSSGDPFEPLGRLVASHHPAVRHVPYTKRGGITGTHAAFIRRCRVIIFMLSGPPGDDEPSQADMALSVMSMCPGDAVLLVIACFDILDHDLPAWKFPTLVQAQGYDSASLQAAGRFLFARPSPTPQGGLQEDAAEAGPRQWRVEEWDYGRDLTMVHGLWRECLPMRFQIAPSVLGPLLDRDAAMCFVVRRPSTDEVLGFCAVSAHTEMADGSGVGSVIVLMVRKLYRGRGIGSSLHDTAVLALTRGFQVSHLRLGSVFPRLLHGRPTDTRFGEWFIRRGWRHGDGAPSGHTDWLLALDDMQERGLSMAGLSFQRCTPASLVEALHLVERVSRRKGYLGWSAQYARLAESKYMSDIIIGFEGATAVSAAILYIAAPSHPLARDMPWAQAIGTDVAGLSCICIIDQEPGMVNNRDSIMVRLLDYCAKTVAGWGLGYLFLDAVRSRDHDLLALGFRRWSSYVEMWKHIGPDQGVK